MNADALDIRLLRFRSKRDEPPQALAAALLEASRVAEALEVVQAGLLEAEDDPALLVLEGRAWFADGDLPQAQAALLRAAKVQPSNADAYRWLSQVLMKRGEPRKAVRVLERAATLRPDDPEIASALSRARRLSHIAEQADSGRLSQPPPPSAPEPPAAVQPPAPRVPAPPAAVQPPAPRAPAPPAAVKPPAPLPAPSYDDADLASDSLVHALVDSTEVSVDDSPALEDEDTGRVPAPQGLPPARDPFRVPEDERPTALSDRPAGGLGWVEPDFEEERPTAARSVPEDERPTTLSRPPEPPAASPEASSSWREAAPQASSSLQAAGSAPVAQASAPALEDDGPDADDSFEPAYVAPSVPAPPGAPDDVSLGQGQPGQAEPPERVLEVVRQQGLFEGDGASEGAWSSRKESATEGTRVRSGLALGWAAALLLAGGGYYGWTRWVEHRHSQASGLVADVRAALVDGEPAARARAEAALGEARQLDPRAEGVDRAAVLLQAMHAVEDGELDVGYLRPALARLEKTSADSLIAKVSSGIIGFSSGTSAPAVAALKALDEGKPRADAQYLGAALAVRLGSEDALQRLERAAALEGVPRAVFLQGVALSAVRADDEAALAWLQRAREAGASGVRVDLWQQWLSARDAEASGEVREADLARAATTDRLLAALVAARRAAARGDGEQAVKAVREASGLPVRDPQMLALLARAASEVSAHDTAYAAARGALQTVPQNADYRDAMVSALLGRGDGEAVERALSDAPADAAWVVVARGRSALLTGNEEALKEAAGRLEQLSGREDDPELIALQLRVELRLGKAARPLFARARKLAATAGEQGRVQLALGETALAAGDAPTAVEALEKARAQLSDSGELLEQLARAYRKVGKPEQARATFERAVQVAPELTAAKAELARIALAQGDYEAAEKGFAQITQGDEAMEAKLGRAQALLGLGRLLDARDLLASLPEEVREGADARWLQVQLLLRMGERRKAEKAAEDLLDEGGRTARHLTLYGDVLFADDEVDKAAGAYDAALEQDGAYPEALIGRARAAVRAEKTEQAYRWLDAAQRALEGQVRPPEVRAALLTTRGMALLLDREMEKARSALSEAVELPGVPADAYFWLGEAQAATKQAGARESYEHYLEMAPEGDLARRARRALKPR